MNKEKLQQLLKDKHIVKKSPDKEIVKSLLNSAGDAVETQIEKTLTEKSATSIFREVYEALRQLGDALWWMEGYEAQRHEASIEIIKTADFLTPEQKVKTLALDRLKTIRHDINYRGFKVSVSQAEEIIDLWNSVSKSIHSFLKKQLNGKTEEKTQAKK